MKKYVVGFILGAALSWTVSANAEEIKSLIGKQVDGQVSVVVDGKEINVPAAIIEGTSYAPVRAVAEAVGRDVDWYEGKVLINSKEAVTVPDEVVIDKPVQESTDTIKPIPIKRSKVIMSKTYDKENYDGLFFIINDETFVPLWSIINTDYNGEWEKPIFTFKKEGSLDIVFTIEPEYKAGSDAFTYQGTVYIKLSTLGLKATISGDTLIIDQE